MAELKTKVNDASVDEFLAGVPKRLDDSRVLVELMQQATGQPAKMWGKSLVGFGSYDYVYASGKAGTWFEIGFSPRKARLVLYIMPGFSAYEELMERLGKHKVGKSCLYLNKLADVDLDVLKKLIAASVQEIRARYPAKD